MRLAGQWREILQVLPEGWATARLSLAVEDAGQCNRAALILGPATPGRAGAKFRIEVHRPGLAGATPELMRRCFEKLDAEGIHGQLELVDAETAEETGAAVRARPALAVQWDALLDRLPPDWSDLYAEVDLDSTDFLDRGALLLAPVNPARYGGRTGLRFRCARRFGYGVSPGMARRCLERLDDEAITGTLRLLRVLSDTAPAMTQGPVFRIGGRSV